MKHELVFSGASGSDIEFIHSASPEKNQVSIVAQSDYYLCLANRFSDEVAEYIRIKSPGAENWGAWSPIPATNQNCANACDQCASDGHYKIIMVTQCNSSAFVIQIATRNIRNNNYTGWNFERPISPNCNSRGVLLCLG